MYKNVCGCSEKRCWGHGLELPSKGWRLVPSSLGLEPGDKLLDGELFG